MRISYNLRLCVTRSEDSYSIFSPDFSGKRIFSQQAESLNYVKKLLRIVEEYRILEGGDPCPYLGEKQNFLENFCAYPESGKKFGLIFPDFIWNGVSTNAIFSFNMISDMS